jgi:ribosome biogenesis GTPase
MTDAAHTLDGTVRRAGGGVYEVELEDGKVIDAALRGRLKLQARTGDAVVAGDRVTLDTQTDGGYTIERVHERTSQLARQAPRYKRRRAKVIIANIDQVAIVFSAAQPDPRLRMLDRFLVLAESIDIPALIVINKSDLVGDDAVHERFSVYERAGYRVLPVSARAGVGIEELRAQLCGKTSVFTGPSGVGKSSLLNALEPGLTLRTGEVSTSSSKGQHTTVSAELIPLACGGYVGDTPGLREVGLWDVQAENVDRCFPEFIEPLMTCRFAGSCTHLHEPNCGVREALARGEISPERYESYRILRTGEDSEGN